MLAAAVLGAVLAAADRLRVDGSAPPPDAPRELCFLYLAGLIVLGFCRRACGRGFRCRYLRSPWSISASASVLACCAELLTSPTFDPSRQLQPGRRLRLASFIAAGHADPVPQAAGAMGLTITHSSAGNARPRLQRRGTACAKDRSSAAFRRIHHLRYRRVSDNDTRPARPEECTLSATRQPMRSINHGVLGYSTVENSDPDRVLPGQVRRRAATAPSTIASGVETTCAARISPPAGTPAMPAITCRARSISLEVRRVGAGYASTSPLFTIVARVVSLWADTARPPEIPSGEPRSGRDPGPGGPVVRNVRAISPSTRDRGGLHDLGGAGPERARSWTTRSTAGYSPSLRRTGTCGRSQQRFQRGPPGDGLEGGDATRMCP